MKFIRTLVLPAFFVLASCGGGVVPPPVPSPSPSASPTPAPCTSSAISVFNGKPGIKHILRPRGFAAPVQSKLPYNGGPVLVNARAYVVLWGFASQNDPVATRISDLLVNVGGSQWYSTMTQYCMAPNVYIQNPTGILKGVWLDPSTPPHAPTTAQLAAEAVKAAQQFGLGSADDASASVVVALPHGVVPSGFMTTYCAWHDATPFVGGKLSYTNLPYMPDAGQGCGANSVHDSLDGVSIVEGHELAESITDPIPPTGWSGSAEIGDLCAWKDLQEVVLSNGVTLPMQPLYSNAAHACVQ